MVSQQPGEELIMRRFSIGIYVLGLVFMVAAGAGSGGAQDKFTMGMGGST
jgi:hypothetical protein